MIQQTGFGYCQARLQARYGALPGESEWQRLAAARTLAVFVEEARVGAMQTWVKGFSGQSSGHDLEPGIRALAWDLVHEAADWVPAPWQAAVSWVAWLPYLPALEYLAGQAPAPEWAAADGHLRGLIDEVRMPDPVALERAGLTDLVPGQGPTAVAARWLAVWRDRWPPCGRAWRRELDAFSERIEDHLSHFRESTPAETWDLRQSLRGRLQLQFHLRLLAPVSVFLYLALVLLDLERLRAELLRRALFDSLLPPGEAA